MVQKASCRYHVGAGYRGSSRILKSCRHCIYQIRSTGTIAGLVCILTAQRTPDPSSRSVRYMPPGLLGKCTCRDLRRQQALRVPPTRKKSETGHRMETYTEV